MWSKRTFEVILYFMKYLHLYNVSIHRKFYQNRFINKCARNDLAQILESRSPRVTMWDVEELMFLKMQRLQKWNNALKSNIMCVAIKLSISKKIRKQYWTFLFRCNKFHLIFAIAFKSKESNTKKEALYQLEKSNK